MEAGTRGDSHELASWAFLADPISSTDLVKDHLEAFRTALLWRKTQRSGRATNAVINSRLPQEPANGWNVFVLKLDHTFNQKDLGQFAHKSIFYYKTKHLKEHQTSGRGR